MGAYTTKARFAEGIADAAPYYREMERKLSWLAPFSVDKAWGIYERARRPSLGFAVMGRTVIDRVSGPAGSRAPASPTEFGNAIDFVEHRNFGVNSDDAELADYTGFDFAPGHVGSILNFYQGAKTAGNAGWHFAYNDSWILGAVHSHIDFQIASPRSVANVWEERRSDLTVTGRELVGLFTFGYQFVRTALNDGAICVNENRADNATFADYIRAIKVYAASKARVLEDLVA